LGEAFQLSRESFSPLSFESLRLCLRFELDGAVWHVLALAHPPTIVLAASLLGWLTLAAAGVLASFLLGTRLIVRPILQLSQRMANQGSELDLLLEPPGASSEVRSLVDSFNRLVLRVQVADRTRKQLLAGISHDLRTPLARLRLRIETQCEPRVAAESEKELHAVERIVSQFLAYLHGESAAGAGAPQSVLMTIAHIAGLYAEQGVMIKCSLEAPDSCQAELAVQRVLSNLIDNALAHGAQPIEISWRAPAADVCELGVWDCGEGLGDEAFRAALEPFVRLKPGGSIGHCGLGLAIVAQIAGQWNAQLDARRNAAGQFGVSLTWSRV
jgi:two-component system osmolarity sensor histidine kinase EnvZ